MSYTKSTKLAILVFTGDPINYTKAMPLIIADHGSIGPQALLTVPERYLIFYSSPVYNEMWCPDCRDVEGLVERIFTEEGAPEALIVYVGDKAQWKATANPYRGKPWNVKCIPTIVKVENGQELKRLEDREITEANLETLIND